MALVEPGERGDPITIALDLQEPATVGAELVARGRQVSCIAVGELLQAQSSACKPIARPMRVVIVPIGTRSSAISIRVLPAHEPVISIDTKKKELVGDFKNAGRNGVREANPKRVARMIF